MVLHKAIIKAISVFGFAALSLSPVDAQRGGSAPPVTATTLLTDAAAPAGAPSPSGAASDAAGGLTTSASAVGSVPAGVQGRCPDGMLYVDGDHCADVEQTCLRWLDPPPYQNLRCAEYSKPTRCKGTRTHERFCIDRDEYPEPTLGGDPREALPLVHRSWNEAEALCEARGARLCKEAEWELACEGPEMSPYPYGWKRDSTACNIDRTDLGKPGEGLIDHRGALRDFPLCTSPYGVHDMTGNVDEWTIREGVPAPYRSSLRGGWWLPGRNRCRAATREHDESYGGKQVGFRCCKDP